MDPLANEPEGTPSIAHLLELEGCASLIQQTDHYLLTPHHWANSNTEVNFLICHLDGKLPILRDTVFIDLQLRQDLDPAYQCWLDALG